MMQGCKELKQHSKTRGTILKQLFDNFLQRPVILDNYQAIHMHR